MPVKAVAKAVRPACLQCRHPPVPVASLPQVCLRRALPLPPHPAVARAVAKAPVLVQARAPANPKAAAVPAHRFRREPKVHQVPVAVVAVKAHCPLPASLRQDHPVRIQAAVSLLGQDRPQAAAAHPALVRGRMPAHRAASLVIKPALVAVGIHPQAT